MVVQLQSTSGNTILDPVQVADEIRLIYSDLYTSTASYSQDELTLFLQDIEFPTLSHSQIAPLEAPITTNCIAEALAHLPPQRHLALTVFL